MKKLLILFFAILPTVVSADYLDDKIIALTKQKQEKIAVLEECQKSKGGLMVAGITTLGVSAIGIGANIGEAVKIKDLDKDIDAAKKDKLDLDAQITTIKMQIAADNTCGGDECAGDGAAAVAVLNGNAPICINNMWRVRMCNEGFSGQHRMCKRKGFVESYIDVCTKITKPENVIVEDLGNGNYEVKVTVDGKVVHEHKLVAAGGIEKITEVPSDPANQMPPININVHGGSGGNANGGNANIGNGGGYDVEYKDAQGNTYHYHIGTININNGTIINGNVNNGTINNGDINNIDGGSGVKGNGGIGWTFSGYGSFIDGKINVVKGNNGVLNFSGIDADMEITAVSDNTSVATVLVNGNTVTINPIGVGTANVTVTVKNKTTKNIIWENTIPVNVSESTVNIGGGNGGSGGNNTITFTNNANPGDTLGCGGTITIQQDAKQQWTINGLTISDLSVVNDSIATVTNTQSTITVIGGKTIGETNVTFNLTDTHGNKKACSFNVTTVKGDNNPWVDAKEAGVKFTINDDSNSEGVCGEVVNIVPGGTAILEFSGYQITKIEGVATENQLADVGTIDDNKAIQISALADARPGSRDEIDIYLKKGDKEYKCTIQIKIVAQVDKTVIALCNKKFISIDELLNEHVFKDNKGVRINKGYKGIQCKDENMRFLDKDHYVLRSNDTGDCRIVGCKDDKYLVVSNIGDDGYIDVAIDKYKTANACVNNPYNRLMFKYQYQTSVGIWKSVTQLAG